MQKLLLPFETIGKYLLAAVLIIVPLFPKFPLVNIPGTYVAVRFEDILVLALGITILIKILTDIKSFLKDEIAAAFLIFFGVTAVSLISGAFLTRSLNLQLGIFHWLRRIEYVVPFFAAYMLLDKRRVSENLNFFIKILLFDVAVIFLYALGQRYLYFPIIVTQNEEYSKGIALRYTAGSHINSTFAGHYDLASFMVLVLPIFLSLLLVLKDKISRLTFFAASGMGLWLLIASISRIGQIAYFASVSAAFILLKRVRALLLVLIISFALAAMSGSLGARYQRIIDVLYQRIKTGFSVGAQEVTLPARRIDAAIPTPTPVPVFEDRSASIRINVEWPRALRAFYKNPVIGTGYSSINLATDSDYLRMLGETGILGFAAFVLIFIRLAKLWFRKGLPLTSNFSGMELGFLAGVTGGVAATFIIALFIDIFEASKFALGFWLILGLAVYLLINREYEHKN